MTTHHTEFTAENDHFRQTGGDDYQPAYLLVRAMLDCQKLANKTGRQVHFDAGGVEGTGLDFVSCTFHPVGAPPETTGEQQALEMLVKANLPRLERIVGRIRK